MPKIGVWVLAKCNDPYLSLGTFYDWVGHASLQSLTLRKWKSAAIWNTALSVFQFQACFLTPPKK